MSEFHLRPWGTARAALQETTGAAAVEPLVPLFEHLANAVRFMNLETELVYLARELLSWQPGLNDEGKAALLLLALASLVSVRQGSCRLPLGEDRDPGTMAAIVTSLLGHSTGRPGHEYQPDQVIQTIGILLEEGKLADVVGQAQEYKPLLLVGPHLYQQRMLELEERLATNLSRRLQSARLPASDEEMDNILDHLVTIPDGTSPKRVIPNAEQRQAIRGAAQTPMALISGGPGTGKTTVVVFLLRLLRRLGIPVRDMAVAAPTGKAANRLGEAISNGLAGLTDPEDRELGNLAPPRTIHRLLGYLPASNRFLHDEGNPLAETLVVIDEASMIDITLMDSLLRALKSDARLVVLGDSEQLPSVEAGAVFKDLVELFGTGVCTGDTGGVLFRLTHSHRMDRSNPAGRNILSLAKAVNTGSVVGLISGCTEEGESARQVESPAQLQSEKVEFLHIQVNRRLLGEFLDHWFARQAGQIHGYKELCTSPYQAREGRLTESDAVRLRRLFDQQASARILCLTNVFDTGTDWINDYLQNCLTKLTGGNTEIDFAAGAPLIALANNYQCQIFNGDQGVAIWVAQDSEQPQLMAAFPDSRGFRLFSVDTLRGLLGPAFAVTVHKSQGSEFDSVALVLPERDIPLNTREILYTAFTRARQSVIVVGDAAVLECGVRRRMHRHSGLAEKLAAGLTSGTQPPG